MKTILATLGLSLVLTGCSIPEVQPAIKYTDSTETIHGNPARGPAPGGWVTFSTNGLPKWRGGNGYRSSLWELSRFSGGRVQGKKRPIPARVGGKDIPITPQMKESVKRFLDETRAKGGTLIVRLGYTWSEQTGCEPDDFNILLSHVRDLSRILAQYDDIVVGVEAGVAGPWGEMHSSDYCAPKYMNAILKTYCDNLSARTPLLIRSPSYIKNLASTNAPGVLSLMPFNDKYLQRIGMYNDGYLGTWWDYGTWAGDFTRERGIQMLKVAGNDKPYGGELAYVTREWIKRNYKLFEPESWNIVKEWYDTHLNFLRNLGEHNHTIATLLAKDLTFDAKVYAFDGAPKLDEYTGKPMSKFVLDHMGYRFVLRDARFPARFSRRRKAMISLDIENTGFGKLLLPNQAELLFVAEGAEPIAVPVELNLTSLDGGAKTTAQLTLTPPTNPGEYELFLRVWCPVKGETTTRLRPIQFANTGMWNKNLKANSFGKVIVK